MAEVEYKSNGNSNRITREYLDSLLIETRYLDSVSPTLTTTLFGREIPSPIMTAALSHLDHFMFEGASQALAEGAAKVGAVEWIGMAEEAEIERHLAAGATLIEIIKPYADRSVLYRKLDHAVQKGLLAVGVDIDHAFGPDGSADVVNGIEMRGLTTAELAELCDKSPLPVIVKGVLSRRDAERSLAAGAGGLLLSHHNNRIEYAVPPLMLLPEIAELTAGRAPIFVDCEIRTGMDAFKALALGASGVCIGRPLMAAVKNGGAQGVAEYLQTANAELAKAMAFTGCSDMGKMDRTVIHKRG